jgi:hypothetical protein
MKEMSDLMDILFMADGLDKSFKSTLRLNRLTPAYNQWLNKTIGIVCPEIKKNHIPKGNNL